MCARACVCVCVCVQVDSEQTNSALGLGVSINRDCSVKSAGGFLVQVSVYTVPTSIPLALNYFTRAQRCTQAHNFQSKHAQCSRCTLMPWL